MEITKTVSGMTTRVVKTIEADKTERFIGCYAMIANKLYTIGIMSESDENMDLALEWLDTGKKNF